MPWSFAERVTPTSSAAIIVPTFVFSILLLLGCEHHRGSVASALAGAARLRKPCAKLHNYRMFDWNDLKYLLAVARQGSTLAAARELAVNQSTVHRRLAELERKVGMRLVHRHPTGYRLTEMGEQLLPRFADVEESVAGLHRAIIGLKHELIG